MKKTIRVRILSRHIKNGYRCVGKSCPLALALMEQGYNNIHVGATLVFVKNKIFAKMSQDAFDFVYNFDSNVNVFPQTVTLELV